jgi:hypothetical protein
VFVCDLDPAEVSGKGTDYNTMEEFIEAMPALLAGLACGRANTSDDDIARILLVQAAPAPDGLWCAELTIFPAADNKPDADTPTDMLECITAILKDDDAKKRAGVPPGFFVSTDRPKDLPPVDDADSGDAFPLVPVLLGIVGLGLILMAACVWRKFISQTYALKDGAGATGSVMMGADGAVLFHSTQRDTASSAGAKNEKYQRRSIDNDVTLPVDRERKSTVLPDLDDLNDIHVPAASAPGFVSDSNFSGTRTATASIKAPVVIDYHDEA